MMSTSILALLSLLLIGSTSRAIRLDRNGYKDVLIAINDDVAHDATLVKTITNAFTKASDYLYKATKQRAYFDEITIVVPETWPDDKTYAAATATETFDAAKVRINPAEEFFGFVSDRAYVEAATTACGVEGSYMHITPGRLTDPRWVKASPPYRMIVHEWAHLRWGVFDEYMQFGLDSDGRPARCPQQINTERQNNRWKFDLNGATGSITWKQYYNDVINFCDDDDDSRTKHYREASNAQNRFCNMQSVWTVMKTNEDFLNGANPPRNVTSTTPTFRIVRKKSSEAVVLVLDVSKAMAQDNRLTHLRQATKNYIDAVEDGTYVGIIFFKNKAGTRRRLFQLTNQKRRDRVAKSLPTQAFVEKASFRKSVAEGITKGLAMLRKAKVERQQIVVITDGDETMAPFLNDSAFLKKVRKANVKINTIEIGSSNPDLSSIALMSGGKTFMNAEMSFEPSVFDDALIEIQRSAVRLVERQYFTSSSVIAVSARSTKTIDAYVDQGLGLETKFRFAWTPGSVRDADVTIRVRDPKAKQHKNIECASDYAMCTLVVPGSAPVGKWQITVVSKSDVDMMFTHSVTSKKLSKQTPIRLETFMTSRDVVYPTTPIITAVLTKGSLPIIEATIVAVVTTPTGEVLNISLNDNGMGTDLFVDDGSYSARFTQFTSDGNYNVKIIATADHTINRPIVANIQREERTTKKAKLGKPVIRDDFDLTDLTFSEQMPPPSRSFEDTITVETPMFSRTESAGAFRVRGFVEGENKIPPGMVTDLKATLEEDGAVRLDWTASGSDMEDGQADRYIVGVSKSFDDLVDKFSKQIKLTRVLSGSRTNLRSPRTSGSSESIKFRKPISSNVIYIALKVRDQHGLFSNISNVVKVTFDDECECPVNPPICKNPIVIYGTVEKSAGTTVRLGSSVEYLKTGFGLSGGSFGLPGFSRPELSVNAPNEAPEGCDCDNVIAEGESYILTASLNPKTFKLEVNSNSYVRKVSADDVTRAKQEARDLIKSC